MNDSIEIEIVAEFSKKDIISRVTTADTARRDKSLRFNSSVEIIEKHENKNKAKIGIRSHANNDGRMNISNDHRPETLRLRTLASLAVAGSARPVSGKSLRSYPQHCG